MAWTQTRAVKEVSRLKRKSGTPGARVIPAGARWWLGLPLAAAAGIWVARLIRERRS